MLKNAYLLAKIGADTAENERHSAENLPKLGNYPTGPDPEDFRLLRRKRAFPAGFFGDGLYFAESAAG